MTALVLGLGAVSGAQFPPRARQAPSDYFPLAVGNQWVYAGRGFAPGGPLTIEVTFADQFAGVTYYQVSGFGAEPAWVRRNDAGELVQYEGGREKLWYAFRALEGASWQPQLPVPCVAGATMKGRAAEVRVPAGLFSPSLLIQYSSGSCADAGLLEEAFAPGVGLVRRSEQTIGGPRIFELAYARVGGTLITGPELSFALALDKPVYQADSVLAARLTVRNSGSLPLTLLFNSGQQYDLAIRDEAGQQVYLWSEGKAFTLALGRLELSPGERTFLLEARLADRTGRTLPPGRYLVEAWLTTSNGKLYAATVPFELKHVF